MVVRYQAANNAGYRIVGERRGFALQLVPSGILYPHITPVIGNGRRRSNPAVLLDELDRLNRTGRGRSRAWWSRGNAHLIMPYPPRARPLTERFLGKHALGTTKAASWPGLRGQIPHGSDFASKTCSTQDLSRDTGPGLAREELDTPPRSITARPQRPPTSRRSISTNWRRAWRRWIADTVGIVHDALEQGQRILLEGTQATFLDLDHGTYPFVTSSNRSPGARAPDRDWARAISPGSLVSPRPT